MDVGHFRSEAARAHFLAAYTRCLEDLPAPDETVDVPTTFGEVRVYRFGGARGVPLLLLPGRNASTPMWGANLPGLLTRRTAYTVDLLGEPGMSIQQRPIADADDQASWLEETLAGLNLDTVHLMGASFGGWSATNHAVRRPGRAASLTLVDPVLTFAPIPLRTMFAMAPMGIPKTPAVVRRRILSWMTGGAAVDDTEPVAAMIASGAADFVLRQPAPTPFTDDQLGALDIPVLAIIAGRSVIHDAARAARYAREVLRHGEIELWPDASHAVNGEFPERIATRLHPFLDQADST